LANIDQNWLVKKKGQPLRVIAEV